MSVAAVELPVLTHDGHRYTLAARVPEQAHARLLWVPALGVAARHYTPFAEALAARGIAVYLHEWRGDGSSNLRPDRANDWAYRELLDVDLPATLAGMRSHTPDMPTFIGGHSLGGQIAACFLGLHAPLFEQLWLVASGTPYWRTFPPSIRWWLPAFYRFAIWISQRRGAFPGRQLRFGGDEARGLIGDWARVGLSGRYAAYGWDVDLEAAMAAARPSVRGVLLARDWLAPRTSLAGLLEKLPQAEKRMTVLDAATLGARADHFGWMKRPEAVVASLLAE